MNSQSWSRHFLFLIVNADVLLASGRGDHRHDFPMKRMKTSNDGADCSGQLDETIDSLNDLSICLEKRPPSDSKDIADYANVPVIDDDTKFRFLTPSFCDPPELRFAGKTVKSENGFRWDWLRVHP